MVNRSTYVIVPLFLLISLLFSFSTSAQTPPHDVSNGIACRDCHQYVIQNGIFKIKVSRGEEQELMCKNCHNPTGQA